jgi:Bacterial extracellular solute-binding proteins, family 5 Middle
MKVQNTRNSLNSNKASGKVKLLLVSLWKNLKFFILQFKNPIKFYQETIYRARKIWKVVWPIDWNKLYNFRLVVDAVTNTSKNIKIALAVLLVCLLISFVSLLGSFFNSLSVEAADNKGTFNEAIFGQTIGKFNPVLALNSEAEKKVVDLIYHPLYRLEYPNFLTANEKIKINPVLLEAEPAWSSDNKILNLKLKRELKWSDGTSIESSDVVYTFNKLKEVGGNPEFRDLYANYKLVATSPIEMELTQISAAKGFNPQIKYLLNFYPVSAKYFEEKNTEELASSPKSILNEVSSGYFAIPLKVKIDNKEYQNPIKDATGVYTNVVLERNRSNTYQVPFIEKYSLKVYSDLIDVGGPSDKSIERASINKKVDLLVRQNDPESKISSSDMKSRLALEQALIPSNTYYIMYANLQSNQWLINTLLRKYVLCSVSEVQPAQPNLEKIKGNKQFLPIQLQDTFDAGCNNSRQELLAQKKLGQNPYTEGEKQQILVEGEDINLNILTLQELLPMMKPIQDQLTTSGIASTITTVKDTDELDRKISEKSYNLAFLPTSIISADPYPMYGAKSRNISTINKNNRVGKEETKFGEGVEKILKDYSESNLENPDLQNKVKEFFRESFVSVNMYSSKVEVNYSPRIKIQNPKSAISNSLFGSVITFAPSIYYNLPYLYVETKKKFFWE